MMKKKMWIMLKERPTLTERLLWMVLCMLAVTGALFTSWNIWKKYETSPTMTVLENTNYPIQNVPFPAITICNNNHVNWDKALEFQQRYMEDADNETIKAYHKFIGAMAIINFGDFDKLDKYFGNSTEDAERLMNINITHLMIETMSTCDEFFESDCWWRTQYYNCCSLFELQKTEYGYCYSFNSETSDVRTNKDGLSGDDDYRINEELRPQRTTTSGGWGGLRFTVNVQLDQIPPVVVDDFVPGIVILVTSPYDFPMIGSDIPAGSSAQILLSAKVTKATPQVRSLSVDRRGCMYQNEGNALGISKYYHKNCMAECHRSSAYELCNCTPYFYPNEEDLPVCDAIGHLCLSKNNDVYNYEKPVALNPFFDDDQEGMLCECVENCNRQEYTADIYFTPLIPESNDKLFLNVHFENPTIMLYRTDVVFGWLDLTVSLGGIAGLFMGFSLLSGAEIIYYLTFRLFRDWWSKKKQKVQHIQRVSPINEVQTKYQYLRTLHVPIFSKKNT